MSLSRRQVIGAIIAIAVVLAVSAGTIFWVNAAADPRSRVTSSSDSALAFERTVFDSSATHTLESVPETIVFAGPLMRPDGVPIELVEMSPALTMLGAREVDGGFFYSAAATANNEISFMGGGCSDKSGAWASCAEVATVTPNSEQVDDSSQGLGLDFHEYEPDGSGGYWAIQYTRVNCESAQQKHCQMKPDLSLTEYVGNCNIVHVVNGEITQTWSAYDALPNFESTSSRYDEFSDVFHCNSIDFYTLESREKVLLSMRNTDSLYQVDLESGNIDWKLGGNHWEGVSLAVENPGTLGIDQNQVKSGAVLSGQHDARYWGNGLFSVFDNGSRTGRAARGLTFSVHESSKSALIRQVFADPEGKPSACTGSFRPLADASFWIAGWGCSASGMTVFKSDTSPVVSVKLDQSSARNLKRTVSGSGPLQWAMSYRVIVE